MRVRVTSPIKYGNEIHYEGAVIDIKDEHMRPGLHVEPLAVATPPKDDGKGQAGNKGDDKGSKK